jgi:hypothetical protein
VTDPFAVDPNKPEQVLAQELAAFPFDFVDKLVALRKWREIPQTEVAQHMHRHESQVSRFENEVGDPRLSTVARYAFAVGARIHVSVEAVDVHGYQMPKLPDNVVAITDSPNWDNDPYDLFNKVAPAAANSGEETWTNLTFEESSPRMSASTHG